MAELWRSLKIRDQVRFAHFPQEFDEPGCFLHEETRAIYQHLVGSQRVLIVSRMDESNYPWIDFEYNADDGQIEYHSLMLNRGGLELVSRKN